MFIKPETRIIALTYVNNKIKVTATLKTLTPTFFSCKRRENIFWTSSNNTLAKALMFSACATISKNQRIISLPF
jgi:hypothetical protein